MTFTRIRTGFISSLCISIGLLWISGCSNLVSSDTKASYILVKPDGTRTEVSYASDKEQVGLDAELDPLTGKIHVKVDKSSTQDAVIQATIQQQIMLGRIFEQLIPLLKAAAAASPAPVPAARQKPQGPTQP